MLLILQFVLVSGVECGSVIQAVRRNLETEFRTLSSLLPRERQRILNPRYVLSEQFVVIMFQCSCYIIFTPQCLLVATNLIVTHFVALYFYVISCDIGVF